MDRTTLKPTGTLKHPHHDMYARLDLAIAKGGITVDELRKEAKRNPQGLPAKYLKARSL